MRTPQPSDRLDEFLKPGSVLECYEVLKSESLCLWTDTVKPRILALFSFGTLGPFQNLLYYPDSSQLQGGHWGLYPFAEADGRRVYPFQSRFLEGADNREFAGRPDRVEAAHAAGHLRLCGLSVFHGGDPAAGKLDWGFRLDGPSVTLRAGFDGPGYPLASRNPKI